MCVSSRVVSFPKIPYSERCKNSLKLFLRVRLDSRSLFLTSLRYLRRSSLAMSAAASSAFSSSVFAGSSTLTTTYSCSCSLLLMSSSLERFCMTLYNSYSRSTSSSRFRSFSFFFLSRLAFLRALRFRFCFRNFWACSRAFYL